MSATYHLDELAIALDPNHLAHILPPQMPPGSRILDLGCGAGQTMIATYPNQVTFGLDPDLASLQLGRTLTRDVQFCCGRAERLPYQECTLNLVAARVSLAYTDIQSSLREAKRVLRPSGRLWVSLHSWRIPWQSALRANWRGSFTSSISLRTACASTCLKGNSHSWVDESLFRRRAGCRKLSPSVGLRELA